VKFSVIGYDDSRLARLTHINLITVAQDPEHMARLAVEAVIERLEGEPGDIARHPPRPRLVPACDEDRYRILSQSIRSGRRLRTPAAGRRCPSRTPGWAAHA
jgi:Periplasmic binding protein-like domain